jgi:hypothetical protein
VRTGAIGGRWPARHAAAVAMLARWATGVIVVGLETPARVLVSVRRVA